MRNSIDFLFSSPPLPSEVTCRRCGYGYSKKHQKVLFFFITLLFFFFCWRNKFLHLLSQSSSSSRHCCPFLLRNKKIIQKSEETKYMNALNAGSSRRKSSLSLTHSSSSSTRTRKTKKSDWMKKVYLKIDATSILGKASCLNGIQEEKKRGKKPKARK